MDKGAPSPERKKQFANARYQPAAEGRRQLAELKERYPELADQLGLDERNRPVKTALGQPSGGRSKGPLAEADTPPLKLNDIRHVADALQLDIGNGASISIPAEAVLELFQPFNGRARHVLASLLSGYSRKMAASRIGIDNETLQNWAKRVPAFAKALQQAEDWGFARIWESELYKRALAGPQDRHSGRLLELVVKARDAAYRDKSQLHMEITHVAQQAMHNAFGGWDADDLPAPPQTPTLPAPASPDPPADDQAP